MSRYIEKATYFILAVSLGTTLASVAHAAMFDHKAIPPTIVDTAHPNVMINMSIETPMQGAAYNDQDSASGAGCAGRPADEGPYDIGNCYLPSKEYIGYFDPNKCYEYDSTDGYFVPVGEATAHACSGDFSGNFMNWATMTAIDEFRWVMTGGNRVIDTAGAAGNPGVVVLERANQTLPVGHSWFPVKKIGSGVANNVNPSTVTPWTVLTNLYVASSGTSIMFAEGSDYTSVISLGLGTYNARVQVCKPDISGLGTNGLEENCVGYQNNTYKPEGLIQENANTMRFALMSYLNDNSQERNGGVLRANMKYTGPNRPRTGGGIEANPNTEWNGTTGVQLDITDPDFLAGGAPSNSTAVGSGSVDSDIGYSGIINYINKFGASGYKSYDPIGELFYECLNYYKNRNPTAEYSSGIDAAMKDNFPVINQNPDGSTHISSNMHWIDPIVDRCQNHYIVGINDANPWLDKRLPGTSFTNATITDSAGGTFTLAGEDYGEPSNADSDINVTTLTNAVGVAEGIDGTSQCIGGGDGTWDNSATNKTINGLGTVMGTCPYVPKQNSYYIAGLAHYANTTDLRTSALGNDVEGIQTVTTFMIDTQEYSASPLTGQMNMLWLAGKYGGFEDSDGDNTNGSPRDLPNLTSEWDRDGDGSPDNYVLASSPENLVNGLRNQFSDIATRVNAGAAAAVIANSTDRVGIRMQALYQPELTGDGGSVVQWVGYLSGIFKDDNGNLREDADGDGILDALSVDPIVRLIYDSENGTRAYYCNGTTTGTTPSANCNDASHFDVKPLSQLRPVWSAHKVLSDLENSTLNTQRAYGDAVDPANNTNGRYIFTWLDDDDQEVESTEIVPFVTSSFSGSRWNWFGIEASSDTNGDATIDSEDADNVINYIRGVEGLGTNLRTRTITIDGVTTVHRLGDIIHSSPVAIDEPNARWGIRHNDTSYTDFKNQYLSRRQVVYVGGNDGMLHAFNSGFYDPGTQRFKTHPNQGMTDTNGDPLPADATPHVLGAELWAYVPKNLLPHLQWLTREDYPHVYYVDGSVQTFDVNIFGQDPVSACATRRSNGVHCHPHGWGTILVATMRFGGNPITYNHDGNNGASSPDITARSAVIILDVTDPEVPPVLLAEIANSELGFTTSRPELVYERVVNSSSGDWTDVPDVNRWSLVFGSGPDLFDSATASASKDPYLFRLDLELDGGAINVDSTGGDINPRLYNIASGAVYALDNSSTGSTLGGANVADSGSFVGHPAATDWNNDYKSDTMYFGLVSGFDVSSQGGKLKRLSMPDDTNWSYSDVIAPSQPFANKPTIANQRVFIGTGRLLVGADNSNTQQQAFYGIRETFVSSDTPDTVTSTLADLVNVTGVEVVDVYGNLADPDGNVTATRFDSPANSLVDEVAAANGWYRNLETTPRNERVVADAIYYSQFIIFPSYRVPANSCDAIGSSRLWGLHFATGTDRPDLGLSDPTSRFNPEPVGDIQPSIELGEGLAFTPTINASGFLDVSTSTGEEQTVPFTPAAVSGGRQSWREIILE